MTVPLSQAALVVTVFAWLAAEGPDPQADRMRADKAALAPLQAYVASWKGVGQLRRGSSEGAWTEQADWAWKFADQRAMLVFEAAKGKYYLSGRLSAGDEAGDFELVATRADGKTQDHFAGRLDDGQLVLSAAADNPQPAASAAAVARISIRTVAGGDRLLVLYERRLAGDRYQRIAEVGYTRVGSSFAKGSGQPECVVTGGLGTIQVTYQGKKYYVCCRGCHDIFEDDPEGVLAEYRERKQKEEKEKREGR